MAEMYPKITVKEKKWKRGDRRYFRVTLSTKYYCGHTLSESSSDQERQTAATSEAKQLLTNARERHDITCKAKIAEYHREIREKKGRRR